MKYKERIEEIDILLSFLKSLKKDLQKTEKVSIKAFENTDLYQSNKLSVNFDFELINIDKSYRRVKTYFENSTFREYDITDNDRSYFIWNSHEIR